MNQPGGHVILFAKWFDDEKMRALFYESAPFSKTRAAERNITDMLSEGYRPLRYRQIHD